MQFTVFMHPSRGLWYWSLDDAEGNPIALGGGGYVSREEAMEAIQLLRNGAVLAPVVQGPTAWNELGEAVSTGGSTTSTSPLHFPN